MKIDPNYSPLRLHKQHTPPRRIDATPADGERLVRAQSLPRAIGASLAVIIVFSALWAGLSLLTNLVLPWLTMLLGVLLGYSVRWAGRGIDWRFPVIAAMNTAIGALAGNVIVAASITANELGVGIFQVLGAVTTMTWPDFFGEVMTPADVIFVIFAAAIAAFYANRRLTRTQFYALKVWQQEQDHGPQS